jgi:hypothetical protein
MMQPSLLMGLILRCVAGLNVRQSLEEPKDDRKLIVQFKSESGELTGPQIELPIGVNPEQLQSLVCKLVGDVC